MKRLTVLRHAKSGWDTPVARDFDRPINDRGRRGARLIGRWLRDEGTAFDQIVASPAIRCVETVEELAEGYGRRITPAWDKRVYLASGATLLDVVHDADDLADHLLLIGHNPGLEDLILMLVPDRAGEPLRAEVEEKFPTASLAELEIDVATWAEIAAGSARFLRLVRPRDLDPALGPEMA